MNQWRLRSLDAAIVSGLSTLLALALLWAPGFAQYPPPVASVAGSVGTANPPTGSSTTLTCAVVDPAGNPVANEPCSFTIITQSGTDASLGDKTVTKLTNAQGIATASLATGSAPGPIVVSMSARGVSSQVTVNVQSAGAMLPATLAEIETAAQAATGPAQALASRPWGQIAILASLALAVGGLAVARVRQGGPQARVGRA